jgi:tRNA(fMet)-specific endonuclease VapC
MLLDTDHVTVLKMPPGDRRTRLVERMTRHADAVFVPVIVVEETMRGWMAALAKERDALRQVFAYRELGSLFSFFVGFEIVPFDEAAAHQFRQLQSRRVRIGTMDLKIAAIALSRNAIVLTSNRRDFEQVPGLRFENWLDGA